MNDNNREKEPTGLPPVQENTAPPAEKSNEGELTAEQEAFAAYYLENHVKPRIPQNEKQGSNEYVKKFKEMIDKFESEHTEEMIDALHKISTAAEAFASPERAAMKLALNPIVEQLNVLKKETKISNEEFIELRNRYLKYSKAIGMINNGMVRHD